MLVTFLLSRSHLSIDDQILLDRLPKDVLDLCLFFTDRWLRISSNLCELISISEIVPEAAIGSNIPGSSRRSRS